MTVTSLMIFGGFLLMVAGFKNVSLADAARGNFDVPKPATVAGVGA